MREMLKVLLQEPAGDETDQWTIPQLNQLLNRALLWVQMKVVRINPGAFLSIDTQAIVSGTNIYAFPVGAVAIRKIIRTRDGKRLMRQPEGYMDVTYGPSVGTGLSTGVVSGRDPLDWCPFGRYARVGPVPNEALLNGLSFQYIPSLTMAVDANVPAITEGLHDAIVNKAWCLGIRPNADISQKAAALKSLEDSLADFDNLAAVPDDSAIQIMPDYDSINGLYGAVTDTLYEIR